MACSKKDSVKTRSCDAYAFFFSEQECDLVTVLVWINQNLLLINGVGSTTTHDSDTKLLLITMSTNRHNHWHDVYCGKQLIYKL